MKHLFILLLLLLVSQWQVSQAFYEAVGRRSRTSSSLSFERTRHLQSTTTTTTLGRRGCSFDDKTSTTTALLASRQFRNVEEMLSSFHDQDLVLINFMAVNCGPCRLQKKELKTVSRSVADLHMVAIDTNRWPSVSSRFDIGKLPCLVALSKGQVVFRLEGYTAAKDIVAQVKSVQHQHQQQKSHQQYRL